jgi:hypothetical protein
MILVTVAIGATISTKATVLFGWAKMEMPGKYLEGSADDRQRKNRI